jgi:hypothetical protein
MRDIYTDLGNPDPVIDLVVVRNTFHNLRAALSNTGVELDSRVPQNTPDDLDRWWYICDNLMTDRRMGTDKPPGCAMQTSVSTASTTVRRRAEHLSAWVSLNYATNGCAGNDLYQISDDAFEPDNAYANIRIWQNRAVRPGAHPQLPADAQRPVVRDPQRVRRLSRLHRNFKTNVFDRFVIVNNTFVVRNKYAQIRADILLRTVSRNNLWLGLCSRRESRWLDVGVWAILSPHGRTPFTVRRWPIEHRCRLRRADWDTLSRQDLLCRRRERSASLAHRHHLLQRSRKLQQYRLLLARHRHRAACHSRASKLDLSQDIVAYGAVPFSQPLDAAAWRHLD